VPDLDFTYLLISREVGNMALYTVFASPQSYFMYLLTSKDVGNSPS